MSDNVPVTRADYDALSARVNWLENMLRDYLMARREPAITELAVIEDGYKLPRTKPRLRDYLLRERETAILTFNHVETALKLPRTKESRHK
jgi:hypothetical protein